MPRTTAELERERQHKRARAHTLRGNALEALAQAKHYTIKAQRNRRRAHALADKIAARTKPTGATTAVAWALKQVGTIEQPANSNWGPKIQDWIKATGYTYGVPWCQCFANAAAVVGGAPQLKTGYTPTVLAGTGGYTRITEAQAQAGDFVFFKWPGVSRDTCDHVGLLVEPPRLTGSIVHTVEGNTSSGNSGSQNNGGGVYHRVDRSKALVAGYVHPPYPKG